MSIVYKENYFNHDIYTREDLKIKRLLTHFRKESEETAKSAICIFWWIVEDMHKDIYPASQIDTFADNYRCDVDLLKSILEDFDLFRIKDGCYVSDRVLRDLSEQEKKVKTKKEASSIRWLLSSFNKAYVEFFGEEPILTSSEIESLKKYNEKIPDLKAKLRDILYTLKNLKFDTDTKFKPCANWLLKENNLARLVNGEFGKLQHKKTAAELKDDRRRQQTQDAESTQPSELDSRIQNCTNKSEALEILADRFKENAPKNINGKAIVLPNLRALMNKFKITDEEVFELCKS